MKYSVWTTEEESYLRDNYGDSSAREIAVELDRSTDYILEKIKDLGMRVVPKKPWTTKDDDILMKNVNIKKDKVIAELLGRHIASIDSRIKKLAISKLNTTWTAEDTDYLEDNVGVLSFDRIASHLERTPLSIQKRAECIGVANTKIESGLITIHQMSIALGIDDKAVKRLAENKGLPAKQKNLRSNSSIEGTTKRLFYYIDINEFWDWAEGNKDLINWYQVDEHSLPLEPEWLKERRKEDYNKWLTRRRPWTPEQDNLLWAMYYQEAKPQKEIALLLGRPVSGVEKRLMRLREIKRLAAS